MRFFKKTIYIIAIILVSLGIFKVAYPVFVKWITPPIPETAKFENSNITISYPLSDKDWLTFNVDSKQDYVKITTNAQFLNSPGIDIDYAVDYEILDDNSKVLYKNTYYLISQKKIYRKWYSKRFLSNPYIINGHYYLSPNQSFTIPLFDFKKKLDKIRFKRHILKNSKIEGVILRVSVPKNLVPGKSNILWLRLSNNKRKELAQSNFFPHQMLSEGEKENLIKNLTSPIGPTNKKISMIRTSHAPYDQLHPKTLTGVSIDIEYKKFDSELYTLYRNSAGGHYNIQNEDELSKVQELFVKMFSDCDINDVKEDWDKLGMNIKEIRQGKRIFQVVFEKADKKCGRGFYVFAKSKFTRNIALEMPHRFFDKGTGLIGYRLMLTGYYVAGSWNSVFRYQTPNYIPYTSDMAHNSGHSYFSAFTNAFCKSMPNESMLIQLHGYTTNNKENGKVKNSKIVLSEATNKPSKKFLYYAERLRKRMPNPLYIYPEVKNIEELAALNNASALTLRKHRMKKFIFMHVEMNQEIRKDMLEDFSLRKNFSISVKRKMIHIYRDQYLKKDEKAANTAKSETIKKTKQSKKKITTKDKENVKDKD